MPTVHTASPSVIPLDGSYRRLFALQQAFREMLETATARGDHEREGGTAALERQVERDWNIPVALATSSAYTALRLVLLAAGVEAGQEVVVPALASATTLLAIQSIGAVPCIVDIERHTLSIDLQATMSAILQGRVAALIAPYTYGYAPDMRALMGLAAEWGIVVIEDVTAVPGVRHGPGRYAGVTAGGVGHFGYLDLSYGTPQGALWGAGLLLCRDEGQREALLQARSDMSISGGETASIFRRGAHMTGLDALCIQAKLAYLDSWDSRQHGLALHYAAAFGTLHGLCFPPPFGPTCFPLMTYSQQDRRHLATCLEARGIQTADVGGMFLPQYCGDRLAHAGALPVAEEVRSVLLLLPCYAELDGGEVERIIKGVQECYAACGVAEGDSR